jgi:predicted nucleic acid-binding protein
VITICDTGPLLAYLNRNDPHHLWAVALMKQVRAPLLVCDPVLTEVVYFLREDGLAVDPLFQLLERQAIRLEFDLSAHWPRIRTLMSRYRQLDLADASIVVMTELHARSQVLTTDRRDFSVYRRNDRQVINFVHPEGIEGADPDYSRARPAFDGP